MRGFKKFKYEETLIHIGKNYIPEISCVNDKLKSELEERIAGYSRMAIGNTIADFSLPGINNETTELFKTNKKYTLVVFWASWCLHCESNLNELNLFLEDNKNDKLEIIAISIDTNKTVWQDVVKNRNYKWKNLIAIEGWNSKVALDYNLYATPTMFLLDREKKILAKPITSKDFIKYYQESGLK